jgi:uncharacterized protein YbjT (DUF2867 family)
MILVVGATGQLGTAVVRNLVASGQPVRALVRPGSRHDHLAVEGVELSFGDLREPETLNDACRGAEKVVATATATVPRGPYDLRAIEDEGYASLIRACSKHRIQRFVYVSVPVTSQDHAVPEFRYRRRVEQRLRGGDLPYTIVQPSLFMESWLTYLGSRIPLRGVEAPTSSRPFWLARAFVSAVGGMIERGIAVVPGPGRHRHAFVAVADVAEFLVRVADHPEAEGATFPLGGPEILSFDEVVAIYARLLGRRVRAVYLPRFGYRAVATLLAPFSPAAANIVGIQWLIASNETPFAMDEVSRRFGLSLTTVEDFLKAKIDLVSATD